MLAAKEPRAVTNVLTQLKHLFLPIFDSFPLPAFHTSLSPAFMNDTGSDIGGSKFHRLNMTGFTVLATKV